MVRFVGGVALGMKLTSLALGCLADGGTWCMAAAVRQQSLPV